MDIFLFALNFVRSTLICILGKAVIGERMRERLLEGFPLPLFLGTGFEGAKARHQPGAQITTELPLNKSVLRSMSGHVA